MSRQELAQSNVPALRIPHLEDWPAVAAALTLPCSFCVAEGHVNRIKMTKRQMYGRPKPDLLPAQARAARRLPPSLSRPGCDAGIAPRSVSENIPAVSRGSSSLLALDQEGLDPVMLVSVLLRSFQVLKVYRLQY
jgi:hypothetical protein